MLSMKNKRRLIILALAGALLAAILGGALAQTGGRGLSLDSPASFPVDI